MLKASELLNQMDIVRAVTLRSLDGLTEEAADRIPAGFANSIRWNLGHILVAQEQMALHFTGAKPSLPEAYFRLFGNKTSPSIWRVTPPVLEVLAVELAVQPLRLRETLGHRLHEAATKPFIRLGRKMETIGELLAYSLYHEGVHTGIISAIHRCSREDS